MACEYREADRSKLEATSSYAGATADEIIIIDRVGEYSGPCFEHLIEIYGNREKGTQTDHLLSVLRAKAVDEYAGWNAD